ncbi:MAG: hypothetical protein Q7R94_02650 [bacterium]|nr:hypothetical protein [bacterium]
MKLVAVIVLSGLLLVLGTQIYVFLGKDGKVLQDFLDFKTKLETAKVDQVKLQAELDYYLNPTNLEKELRARFNYRAPDEKLLILVPRNVSSVVSSTVP